MSDDEGDEAPEEMRLRIAGLQRSLAVARARGEQERSGASRGVLQRLAEARSDLEADRRALSDLSAALDRLGSQMRELRESQTSDALPSRAEHDVEPARPAGWRRRRWFRRSLLALALALAAGGVGLLVWSSRSAATAPPTSTGEPGR